MTTKQESLQKLVRHLRLESEKPENATPKTIKQLRINTDLTQRDLAEASGVSVQNICSIEKGTRKLTQKTAKRLLDAIPKAVEQRDHKLAQAVTAAFNKPALIALRNAQASATTKEDHNHAD